MKKKVLGVIAFFVLNLIFISNVNAKTSLNATLNSDKGELYKDEEIVVTLKLDEFNEVEEGINAYKGTLEYDEDIFETITQSDFTCLNYWEELRYNPNNKEFVLIKKTGSKKAEDILTITLKTKQDVKASKTKVAVKNVVVSEGFYDIFLNDA